MPIQAVGASAVPGVQLYYVAPPQGPNLFSAFWSNYLQARTPFALQHYQALRAAQDPTRRIQLQLQLEQLRNTAARESAATTRRVAQGNHDLLTAAIQARAATAKTLAETTQRASAVAAQEETKRREARAIPESKQKAVGESLQVIEALVTGLNALGPNDAPDQLMSAVQQRVLGLADLGLGPGAGGTVRKLVQDRISAAPPALRESLLSTINALPVGAGSDRPGVGGDISGLKQTASLLDQIIAGFNAAGGVGPVIRGEVSGGRRGGVPGPELTAEDIDRAFAEQRAQLEAVGDPFFNPIFRTGRGPIESLRAGFNAASTRASPAPALPVAQLPPQRRAGSAIAAPAKPPVGVKPAAKQPTAKSAAAPTSKRPAATPRGAFEAAPTGVGFAPVTEETIKAAPQVETLQALAAPEPKPPPRIRGLGIAQAVLQRQADAKRAAGARSRLEGRMLDFLTIAEIARGGQFPTE